MSKQHKHCIVESRAAVWLRLFQYFIIPSIFVPCAPPAAAADVGDSH